LASLLDEVAPLPDDQKAGKNANRIELISRTIDVITKLRRERKRGAQEEEEEEGVARDSKRVKTDEHSAGGEEAAGSAADADAEAEAETETAAVSNEVESCSRHPLMMVLPIVEPAGSSATEAPAPSNVMVYPVPFFNGGYDIPTPSQLGGIFNIPVSATKPGVSMMKVNVPKPLPQPPMVAKAAPQIPGASEISSVDISKIAEGLFNKPPIPTPTAHTTESNLELAHCA